MTQFLPDSDWRPDDTYRRDAHLAGKVIVAVFAVLGLAALFFGAAGCKTLAGDTGSSPTTLPAGATTQPSPAQQVEIAAAQGVAGLLIPPPYNELAVLALGVILRDLATRKWRKKNPPPPAQ